MKLNWRALAIIQSAILLLAVGVFAGVTLSSRLKPASPTPAASVPSPSLAPTPSPSPSVTIQPSPIAPPEPPAKQHFVVVSTDWQDCQQIPHCYAHGIFLNNGNATGSVAVTLAMPPESGFTNSCQTTVPVTPAGSVGEARCDLGDDAKLYLDENSPNTLKPPVAALSNP